MKSLIMKFLMLSCLVGAFSCCHKSSDGKDGKSDGKKTDKNMQKSKGAM